MDAVVEGKAFIDAVVEGKDCMAAVVEGKDCMAAVLEGRAVIAVVSEGQDFMLWKILEQPPGLREKSPCHRDCFADRSLRFLALLQSCRCSRPLLWDRVAQMPGDRVVAVGVEKQPTRRLERDD